jgi:hypothetical protein
MPEPGINLIALTGATALLRLSNSALVSLGTETTPESRLVSPAGALNTPLDTSVVTICPITAAPEGAVTVAPGAVEVGLGMVRFG